MEFNIFFIKNVSNETNNDEANDTYANAGIDD